MSDVFVIENFHREEFGQAVKKARSKKHMRLVDLARVIGSSRSKLQVVESGGGPRGRAPRVDLAMRLAKFLNIDLQSYMRPPS